MCLQGLKLERDLLNREYGPIYVPGNSFLGGPQNSKSCQRAVRICSMCFDAGTSRDTALIRLAFSHELATKYPVLGIHYQGNDLHRDKYCGTPSVSFSNPALRAAEPCGSSSGRSSNATIAMTQYAPLSRRRQSRSRTSISNFLPHVLFPAFTHAKSSISLFQSAQPLPP